MLLLSCFSVVSDSVRSQRRQPTRLPRPWDSPGKNTGVGSHFLLQCMKVKRESEVSQSCPVSDSSRPHGLQPTRLLRSWEFPVKSTGVGPQCLLRRRGGTVPNEPLGHFMTGAIMEVPSVLGSQGQKPLSAHHTREGSHAMSS